MIKDWPGKMWLIVAAMFITSIISYALLLIPTPGNDPVYGLIQVLLPLFCMCLMIKLYFDSDDQNIKFISMILSGALLFWTISSASWYLPAHIIPRSLHLGWLEKSIGAIGWLISYGLIAYGLFSLKNSRQWYLSPPVNRLINITGSVLAAGIILWTVTSISWDSGHAEDAFKLLTYILLDILIFATIAKLYMMNLKVGLRYLIASIFFFYLLNSAGDLIYLASFILENSFLSIKRDFITGIVYSASILFLTTALFIYMTDNFREKALRGMSKKLKDTALAMENIVMQSPDAICIFDVDGRAALVNDNFLGLFEMKRADVAYKLNLSMLQEKIPGISVEILEKLKKGVSLSIPLAELRGESGSSTYAMVKLYPILTSDDHISCYAVALEDISERIRLEQDLKVSLDEKEVLLKEIHHRVKNNLQIVYSLLNIQAGYISDQPSLDAFKETQNRVMSMALIHEKLYRSKDLAKIDFSEYIRALASQILKTYATGRNVSLKVDVDEVRIGIDVAVPCGLMINEMISNSVKHAFPDGRQGEICIDMHEVPGSGGTTYRLTVKDNGIGLPAHFDIGRATSLGMVLINSLAGQLSGRLEIRSAEGTEYSLTFRETPE